MELIKNNYRIFGRTRGRSINKYKISQYEKLINSFKITKLELNTNYILDIGTGYGETSLYFALRYKKYTIISCEKYINGNLNLMRKALSDNIKNINLFPADVNKLLDINHKNEYFNIVSIFFPDPWPKKKHYKRRLFNNDFLFKLHKYMKKDAIIYISTDSQSYNFQIIKTVYFARDLFKWVNQEETHLSIKDYLNIETKFYKKAIFVGKKPSLFILKKI
tara:strand:+ start:762 stop:1421 length:660 start_codon:yes stop_codon:yes gene_type:complete